MLSVKCEALFRNIIYRGSDADRFYTEMRIAKNECDKDNPFECIKASRLRDEFRATQEEVDKSFERFSKNCVLHSDITRYGD